MTDPFMPGLLARLPEPPRKVALLRASRIGDFLCAVPAFRALRTALPGAEITMVTLPLLRDLAVRSPYLDRFVAFPGFPGIAEQFFDARRATAFFQQMQAEQFDLAVQMQGSGVYSNPFTLMLGARMTAGFVRPGDPPGPLDAALPIPEHEHEVRRMLALTTFLGAPPQGEELEYPLWPEDHAAAEALVAGAERPLIGLHPGARARTRRWALDRFAAVGVQLRRRYGGTFVILGDAEERPAAGMLAQQVDGPCLNLAGRTSLAVLGAVIAQLAVLVTNDSGPAHVAYALGTPTVTVLGGGRPAAYVPLMDGPYRILSYEVPCRPCDYADCPVGYTCLEGVTVQQAVEAAGAVILQRSAISHQPSAGG
jgi:ADP-heptose:LPS heptosyltransferase